MEKFKQNEKKFLICPWCPPGPVTILIENCQHNPFALMKKVRELENKVYLHEKAHRILEDLKDVLNEL